MKRVLLLFTFVALILAGVVSADRPAGACCPAGEAGQAQMQDPADAHHASGTCCEPKAEGRTAGMCMGGDEGRKACCGDAGRKARCADGTCAKGQGNGQEGCCQENGEGGAKAGCCQKKGAEGKAGCCMKAGAHGGRS
jgi:hypothetical protein